jgi:hypothetical protein
MSRPPKGKPDRTSTVVAAALVLLGALGVVTIFWGPLLAFVEPSGAAEGAPGAATTGPTVSAARADAGAHS